MAPRQRPNWPGSPMTRPLAVQGRWWYPLPPDHPHTVEPRLTTAPATIPQAGRP